MAKKILIVDDEDLNRKLFVSILREGGYETLEAADGLEALTIIKNESPALVLLDIILPKMNGIEVLKTCREKGYLGDAKVYALTAAMMPEINDAGFNGVITKPIRIMEFLDIIEKTMK